MASLLNNAAPGGLLSDPRIAVLQQILDPAVTKRAALLPMVRTMRPTGSTMVPEEITSREFGAPQMAVDMLGSALLPGAAAQGYTPTMQDAAQFSIDTMLGGLLGRAPSGALTPNSLASKGVNLYNIKAREARPFEADYLRGAPTNAEGLLTRTIDGDPINVGGRVVGRRVAGRADEALPSAEFDAIAKEGTGRELEMVAQSTIGRGVLGKTGVDPKTKRPLGVALSRDLNPAQLQNVYAHEIGHVIDQLAGEITPSGISKELKALYNWANNPNRNARGEPYQKTKSGNLKLWTPENAGYKKSDVEREYIAEAIRAYMSDPNAMKTDYPKTAAFLRKKINNDPNVRDIIQFNMGGGLPLGLFGSWEKDI